MPIIRDNTERFGAPAPTGTKQFADPAALGALLGQIGGRGVTTQPTAGPFAYDPMAHVQLTQNGAVQNAGMVADLLSKYGPAAYQMLADINGLGEGGSLGGGAPGMAGPGTTIGPWMQPTPQSTQQPVRPPAGGSPRGGGAQSLVQSTAQPAGQAAQSLDISSSAALGALFGGGQQPQQQPMQTPSPFGQDIGALQSLFAQSMFAPQTPQGLKRRM